MRLRILFISLVLFNSCKNSNGNLPYYNDASFSPIFISENSYNLNEAITHQIEKFEFLNQDNQLISDKEIDGKIHVANFFFTSCTSICPSMTKNMKNISREFKNDTILKTKIGTF
jgi:protein SCO1/2